MQDRFTKLLLVLVAGLLAANLVQSQNSPSFIGSAQAQSKSVVTPAPTETKDTLRTLAGFPVEDMNEVVAVGDGRSFVVTNKKGFMVYQILPSSSR